MGLRTVQRALAEAGPARPTPRERQVHKASAVLAPLFERGEDPRILLTRRTTTLRAHSGELSFPGGAQDPGETLVETALREAHEEIALDPALPEIIGELDHLSTFTSGSIIVPFVAELEHPPGELVPNPGEVDAILEVRIADLLDPDIYHEEQWPLFGDWHTIVFFDLGGDVLWGATAAMMRQLLGLATGTVARGEIGHI